jgi:three-Cys-motif partner protein
MSHIGKEMKTSSLHWVDDGLPSVVKRSQMEEKYGVLSNYMHLFATGMKNKWARVYVDLYAGSGVSRDDEGKRFFKGTAIHALSVKDPFDRYIFCEEDPKLADALKQRIDKHFPGYSTVVIAGSCDEKVDEIVGHIPLKIGEKKVLTLCMMDPNSLEIDFRTINRLAGVGKVDFIVLLALMGDGNRNEQSYTREGNRKIELLLGNRNWRTEWEQQKQGDDSFPRFIVSSFEKRMRSIGYLLPDQEIPLKEVRSAKRNLPLYHLTFYSKDETGFDFWKKAMKYSSTQTSLEL